MLEGYRQEYQRISQVLPKKNAIYFTSKKYVASPLRFMFGINTYIIKDVNIFMSKVQKLMNDGFDVYLIQYGPPFYPYDNISLNKIGSINLTGLYPIESGSKYPDLLHNKERTMDIYRISKGFSQKSNPNVILYEWKPTTGGFFTLCGKIEKEKTLTTFRQGGQLLGGPYLTLEKGIYKVRFIGQSLEKAKYNVFSNEATNEILIKEKKYSTSRLKCYLKSLNRS
ncbi:hypothetical protein [Leptospira licerasiae]|uniref:hypothetical protein n=1 Tax=Leptospira licerasiae TaxID=447106 RepID=UPI0010843CB4|nr:hypothetical protein [Leptospira licerasiae]TGM89811.1 hypothetical protein EHR05_03160 [Leptospira licerasiae]